MTQPPEKEFLTTASAFRTSQAQVNKTEITKAGFISFYPSVESHESIKVLSWHRFALRFREQFRGKISPRKVTKIETNTSSHTLELISQRCAYHASLSVSISALESRSPSAYKRIRASIQLKRRICSRFPWSQSDYRILKRLSSCWWLLNPFQV